MEKFEEIVESYRNGQKKQMVSLIRDYGASQFFIDFETYIDEVYPGYPELYIRICVSYHSNVKAGMLVT